MGSIFGKAKKGFGMLKAAKKAPTSTFMKRRQAVKGLKGSDVDWTKFKEEFSKSVPPGVKAKKIEYVDKTKEFKKKTDTLKKIQKKVKKGITK